MDELKPCPFCGAEGDINYNYDKKFAPYCINEDCFLNELNHGFETEQEAIEAWNRRTNDGEMFYFKRGCYGSHEKRKEGKE